MHEQMQMRIQAENPQAQAEEEEAEEEEEEEEEVWRGLEAKPLCPESERLTAESFAAWKLKFDAELIASGVISREKKTALTGREIFTETGATADGGEETVAAEAEAADIG